VKQYAVLAFSLLVCLSAGGIGSIATARFVAEWYPALVKPSWTPPSWLFGPACTVLYILMSVAAWLVWRSAGSFQEARTALKLFSVQLVLKVVWSWIFIGLRMPGPVLLELFLLSCIPGKLYLGPA